MKNTKKILFAAFLIEFATVFCVSIYLFFKYSATPLALSENMAFAGANSVEVWLLAFFSLVALLLFVTYFLIGKNVAGFNRNALVYLSYFVILSSIWIYLESTKDTRPLEVYLARGTLDFSCFHLMSIPFVFYVREICTHGKRVFDVFLATLIISFAYNFSQQILRGFMVPTSYLQVHIIIAIMGATTLILGFIEIFKYKNRRAVAPIAGIVIFILAASINLVRFYTNSTEDYTAFVTLGLFILIMFLVAGTAKTIAAGLSKAMGFAAIASATPCGIFRAKNDEKLSLIYANKFFYEIYGYSSEKDARKSGFFTGTQVLLMPNSESFSTARQEKIREGINSFEIETREKDRYGNEMWLLNRLNYRLETNEVIGSVINITDRKLAEERLHVSEEEYKIVALRIHKMICRYDIPDRIFSMSKEYAERYNLQTSFKGMPEAVIDAGVVSKKSIPTYEWFYNAIHDGQPNAATVVQLNELNGTNTWWTMTFDTVFDADGTPKRAIIILEDITEQREKEIAYEKWKQEIADMPKEKTALFEWNLTQDLPESEEGDLVGYFANLIVDTFDERTRHYTNDKVYLADRQAYSALLNKERLIGAFYEGKNNHVLEYRAITEADGYKWMRITVQLVSYPRTGDIKAYIIMTDIDTEKRENLNVKTRAREDPLTGILNRGTIAEEIDTLLQSGGGQHAIIMLDLDGFKMVNDTFGHIEGDNLLVSVAQRLKSLLREGDLIGRIGGDEFMLCLKNIPYDDVIDRRAQLICRLLQTQYDNCVSITGSVGVAMFPRNGTTFEELYHKADLAMYNAKEQGRNRCVFYHDNIYSEQHKTNSTPIDEHKN